MRTAAEHAAGHVPGATLVPYTRLPLLAHRIPEAATLVVHCQSGSRSAPASAWLASQGRRVINVAFDWSEWVEARMPVERGGGVVPAEAGAAAR